MSDTLTTFLQYDYGQAADLGKTLLPIYGGSLGVAFVFIDKFLPSADDMLDRTRKWALFGLYALGAATIFDIAALMINYSDMLRIVHKPIIQISDDIVRHNRGVGLPLYASMISLLVGLIVILKAAVDRGRAQKSAATTVSCNR